MAERRIGRRLVDYLIETRSSGIRSPVAPLSLGWAEGDILVKPDSVVRGDRGLVVVCLYLAQCHAEGGFPASPAALLLPP